MCADVHGCGLVAVLVDEVSYTLFGHRPLVCVRVYTQPGCYVSLTNPRSLCSDGNTLHPFGITQDTRKWSLHSVWPACQELAFSPRRCTCVCVHVCVCVCVHRLAARSLQCLYNSHARSGTLCTPPALPKAHGSGLCLARGLHVRSLHLVHVYVRVWVCAC